MLKIQGHVVNKMDNQESLYYCGDCCKSFAGKRTLQNHIARVHNKHRPSLCDICAKCFFNKGDLDKHKRKHTGERPFSCDHCGSSFSFKRDMKRHKRRIHNTCEICDEDLKNQDALKEHTISKHGPNSLLKCDKCPKTFFDHHRLKYHKSKHNDDKSFACDICYKLFVSKSAMIKHEIVFHQKYVVRSDHSQHEELTNVTLTPLKDKNGNIVEAGRKESEIKVTRRNMKEVIYDEDNQIKENNTSEGKECLASSYTCPHCHKHFIRKRDMEIHIIFKHTQERPFDCDHCEKRFKTKKCVNLHLRSHGIGGFSWRCEQCGKSFYQISGYHTHLKVHSKVRDFACEDCEMTFKLNHQLKRHRLIHKPEFVHTCDICGKNFKRSDTLTNHKRRHTGEHPYQCDKCNWTGPDSTSFIQHTKNHAESDQNQQTQVNQKVIKQELSLNINQKFIKNDVRLKVNQMDIKEEVSLKVSHINNVVDSEANDFVSSEVNNLVDSKVKLYNSLGCKQKVYEEVIQDADSKVNPSLEEKKSTKRCSFRFQNTKLPKPFPCSLCDLAFNRRLFLTKHIQLVHLKN